MTRNLAFIKLHAPFFVFHRFEKSLRLFFTHLAFLLRLDLRGLLCLLGLFFASAFHVAR